MESNSSQRLSCIQCPPPVEGLSWVYILQLDNGKLYVGQTGNVAHRLNRHASGTGARQTKFSRRLTLVFAEGPMDPVRAVRRERQVKKWSRAKKLALIRGDLVTLYRLSRSSEKS